jgi:hypothetical protein
VALAIFFGIGSDATGHTPTPWWVDDGYVLSGVFACAALAFFLWPIIAGMSNGRKLRNPQRSRDVPRAVKAPETPQTEHVSAPRRHGPVAIRIDGASDVTITDNVAIGMPLLDAENVKGLYLSGNEAYMPAVPVDYDEDEAES